MKNTNKYIAIGLLIFSLTIISKHLFTQLPEFVVGLGMGTGIGLELFGAYSINHDVSKLKKYKINLYKKCFNR